MEAGIVQKIFRDHFATYSAEHALSNRERGAAWNIATCRTPEQGYHVDACPNGDYRGLVNNSCKHRSCPKCGSTETELWFERRQHQALSCLYFHIVFTISHELHGIWCWNRKLFTDLMFRAAWHSFVSFATAPNQATNSLRSCSSSTILRRSIPRTITWWKVPGASNLAWRAISLTSFKIRASNTKVIQASQQRPLK